MERTPTQVQGPGAVQWVGPGLLEERAARTGDRNLLRKAVISANDAGFAPAGASLETPPTGPACHRPRYR